MESDQPSLFDEHIAGLPDAIAHDGDTYNPFRDASRLNAQTRAVFDLMRDGQWRTLAQISHFIRQPEASISARLRDLRKAKYGSNDVSRHYLGQGLYAYRLLPNERFDG